MSRTSITFSDFELEAQRTACDRLLAVAARSIEEDDPVLQSVVLDYDDRFDAVEQCIEFLHNTGGVTDRQQENFNTVLEGYEYEG